MTDERDQGKFNLRLPPGMRERIAKEAKANGRSMNAEIVYRLETTFADNEETEDRLLVLVAKKLTEMNKRKR